MERPYRAVRCEGCVWQDYYDPVTRVSYPPRCPECGSLCSHEFFSADFTGTQRRLLGHDRGTRFVFGDPRPGYQNMRDRSGIRVKVR